MVDLHAVIREVLTTAGTPLRTLVSDRVYLQPAPTTFVNGQKAVTYLIPGGMPDAYVDDYEVEVNFICCGGNGAEKSFAPALEVYRALHDRVHAMEPVATTSGYVMSGLMDSIGQNVVMPDTGWYVVLVPATFLIRGKS